MAARYPSISLPQVTKAMGLIGDKRLGKWQAIDGENTQKRGCHLKYIFLSYTLFFTYRLGSEEEEKIVGRGYTAKEVSLGNGSIVIE